jgi:hypothetical protein
MSNREALKQQLDHFTDDELQQIADFMEFLTFRTQRDTTLPTPEDTPKSQILTDFRQAWQEAMTGQGIPASQLWAELENE